MPCEFLLYFCGYDLTGGQIFFTLKWLQGKQMVKLFAEWYWKITILNSQFWGQHLLCHHLSQKIRIRTEQYMTSKTLLGWKSSCQVDQAAPCLCVEHSCNMIFATRWQPRLKTIPNPEQGWGFFLDLNYWKKDGVKSLSPPQGILQAVCVQRCWRQRPIELSLIRENLKYRKALDQKLRKCTEMGSGCSKQN